MLLQNNTEVLFSLGIKLTFDTGETKVGTVDVGDYLLLKFNYDGSKYSRACHVVDITPVMLTTQPVSYTATIVVDCSTKFQAQRLRVAAKDILDFKKVSADYIESLAPDYVITDDMFEGDALPATPDEVYKISGVSIGGIEEARLLR